MSLVATPRLLATTPPVRNRPPVPAGGTSYFALIGQLLDISKQLQISRVATEFAREEAKSGNQAGVHVSMCMLRVAAEEICKLTRQVDEKIGVDMDEASNVYGDEHA